MATVGSRVIATNGKLSFYVEDEYVEFNLIKASKFLSIFGEYHQADVLDRLLCRTIFNKVNNDPLEHYILNDAAT